MKPVIARRPVSLRNEEQLLREGLHPVLARLAAARGIGASSELDDALANLLPPGLLLGMDIAAKRLADAVERRERVLIVADYDCDGATACAVGLRALRALRFQDGRAADVRYLVPDRFRYGYGLTPEIVQLAAQQQPHIIVTVDNGIASTDGVAAANALGIEVIVTDHHLPGAELPAATAIVNPNQPGCTFPSKAIAGVGVMFYLMLALRAELRKRGAFGAAAEPNLADLLDLVALGTVADVVPLDRNNRVLVGQGLKRMRAGRLQPGLRALFAVCGRDPRRAAGFDLGFLLGPRINAAGRLTNMGLGIECLVTEDYGRALEIARSLDDLNRERRVIEGDMREQAERMLAALDVGDSCSLSLYDPSWHQGVVGILAGRVKERWHRPTIAFARSSAATETAGEDELKGSGRSIPGLHLRDALDLVAKREPGLLLRFGGHAAAAGLTLKERDYPRFVAAFEQAVHDMLSADALARRVDTDGSLELSYLELGIARMLEAQIWGQGFPQPLFCDEFSVVNQRVVGTAHLKLKLKRAERTLEAMLFNSLEPLPATVRAAYRVSVNEFNGVQMLQLVIEHWEPAQ